MFKGLRTKIEDEKLDILTKERDESNDQNVELYEIIEKLRRDLEYEREINLSLERRLNEVDLKKGQNSLEHSNARASTKVAKSLDPDHVSSGSQGVEDTDRLKLRLKELENQLADKNRQLKIRSQNLNDIKRALQKELMEHSKTQEELFKTQNQLRQINQNQRNQNDSALQRNGSSVSDTAINSQINNANNSDKNLESSQYSTNDSPEGSNVVTSANMIAQLDRMSCISHSSASVDDFDPYGQNQNNYSKDVNHEYLRNVLYRYMTSTDNATAMHLVKALSVLMNFTPEQYKAIKNAMNARSSWLRLK